MKISKLDPKDKPYTPEEIHAEFIAYGITVTSWCIKYNFHRLTVVDLLRGKRIGVRGESHRAAVLLGLKRDPKTKHINHPFKLELEELAA
jgi:gp16 family phage-associated protein